MRVGSYVGAVVMEREIAAELSKYTPEATVILIWPGYAVGLKHNGIASDQVATNPSIKSRQSPCEAGLDVAKALGNQ